MEVLLATKSNQDLVSLMDGSWNMLFHHVSLQSWASSGGKSVALVLGKALLWKVFDDKNNFVVPSFILQHVKGAYRDHIGVRCTLQEGDNTVEKAPLTVYKSGGNEAQVIIEIVFKFDTAGGEEGAGGGKCKIHTDLALTSIKGYRRKTDSLTHNYVVVMRREKIDMKAHYARGEAHHKRDLNTVNRNVMAGLKETKRIRLAMNPTSGEQQLDGNKGNEIHDDRIDCNAKLCKTPKNALVLWNEYQEGIGDTKQ